MPSDSAVQIADRRDHSGGDQQRIARQEKSHEQSRLHENDDANRQHSAPLDQAADVVQLMENVSDQLNHRDVTMSRSGIRRLKSVADSYHNRKSARPAIRVDTSFRQHTPS